MHSPLEPSYWKSLNLPIHTIQWGEITNASDTAMYFSYYGAHVEADTLMCFGWYNSYEHTQWAVWGVNWELIQEKGSINPVGLRFLEEQFELQRPIFAWKLWWEDLHATLHKWWTVYKLQKILPILVEFTLRDKNKKASFKQFYLKWVSNWGELMTLVWDRSGLYSTYKKVFWTNFPLDRIYPRIEQTPQMADEWRRARGLPPL